MVEEFNDIIAGLEQRISLYKSKLSDYQKRRDKIDEDIKTVKKYLELAETLYRVEVSKRKTSSGTGEGDEAVLEKRENSDIILLEKTRFSGLSVPQGAFLLLKEAGVPVHAKEIYRNLIEGGLRIRSKTPITSIAISLSRDKRFKKVAPNTFDIVPPASDERLGGDPTSERDAI